MTFKRRAIRFAGFTLFEVIIYTAIMSIMLVAFVEIGFGLRTSRGKYSTTSVVHDTSARVLKTIEYLVRNSDGLVEDANDNDCLAPTKLRLYYATSSGSYAPPGCFQSGQGGAIGIELNSATGGIELLCYQSYPNSDKAGCDTEPPNTYKEIINLTDASRVFIGQDDLVFSTTTTGSRLAVEASLNLGYRASGLLELSATTTASTTVNFRSVTSTYP